MKRLTEGAHQTSDDLTIANTAYFGPASFWYTNRLTTWLIVGDKVEVSSRWQYEVLTKIEDVARKKLGLFLNSEVQ